MTKSLTLSRIPHIEPLGLVPALIGAGVGTLGSLGANRKSRSSIAAAAIIGGAAGLAAWSSRRRVIGTVHTGLRGINAACDYYYVARHPIDYA